MKTSYAGNFPLKIVIIGVLFPFIEKISITWAGRIAYKLFFHPIRFKIPQNELNWRAKAEIQWKIINGKKAAILHWKCGKENAETVLLMHGWGSRSTHFHVFIEHLLNEGYNVVAPDAPGHGASKGKETTIFEFAELLHHTATTYKCKKWVTHSLGGASSIYAILNYNIYPEHLTLIATPAIAQDIISVYIDKMKGSRKLDIELEKRIIKQFGKPLKHVTASVLLPQLDTQPPLLFIYDTKDKDAPVMHGELLHSLAQKSELEITTALGHTKIIKSPSVLDMILKRWQ